MGLDMYLKAERYVSGFSFEGAAAGKRYNEILAILGAPRCEASPGIEVKVTCGYWRKANAIHSWFVRECGGGVDECQDIGVPREKLHELRTTCLEVLAALERGDTGPARDRLAPQSGFFFGGTGIDDAHYRADLRETTEIIVRALESFPEDAWSFTYQASW